MHTRQRGCIDSRPRRSKPIRPSARAATTSECDSLPQLCFFTPISICCEPHCPFPIEGIGELGFQLASPLFYFFFLWLTFAFHHLLAMACTLGLSKNSTGRAVNGLHLSLISDPLALLTTTLFPLWGLVSACVSRICGLCTHIPHVCASRCVIVCDARSQY